MAINMHMRMSIHTLVDITETNIRKSSNKTIVAQQSNLDSFIQTIGLRANIEPVSVLSEVIDITNKGFGTQFEGKQRVWTFIFDNPYTGAITEDMMLEDFDLIPIITGLNETGLINNSVVRTKSNLEKNIVFDLGTPENT